MTLGEKLQRLRRARGLTQEQLALGLVQWIGPWLWKQGKQLIEWAKE